MAADPKAVMREVYRQLDLGDFDQVARGMDAYLRGQGEFKPNVFELPDALREKILKRWRGYIKRFGFGDAVRGGEKS